MYSVLIVSDSHGLTDELIAIKNRHQEVTHMIHCGDSELQESSPSLSGFETVKGNCDWNGNFVHEKLIEIGTLTFFVTHGHLYGVKQSLLNLHYKAQELGVDVICYGHSHIPYAEMLDNQLFINPGSIHSPQKFNIPSYVIVKWTNDKDINVNFYNLSGAVITTFPYERQIRLK